jgi:hypothetical protein
MSQKREKPLCEDAQENLVINCEGLSLDMLKQENTSSVFAKCQTVWSILEGDKIAPCGKIQTPVRTSKLNRRVLCVLIIVHLISAMKCIWHRGNYHWSVSWDNQLRLRTLILLGKCPSPSTVPVSTLFFWKQFKSVKWGIPVVRFW